MNFLFESKFSGHTNDLMKMSDERPVYEGMIRLDKIPPLENVWMIFDRK